MALRCPLWYALQFLRTLTQSQMLCEFVEQRMHRAFSFAPNTPTVRVGEPKGYHRVLWVLYRLSLDRRPTAEQYYVRRSELGGTGPLSRLACPPLCCTVC